MKFKPKADHKLTSTAAALAADIEIVPVSPNAVQLKFGPLFANHLGLALRQSEARRLITTSLRGCVKREWLHGEPVLLVEFEATLGNLRDVIDRCSRALAVPATRPLTPKLVPEALSISTQERLR